MFSLWGIAFALFVIFDCVGICVCLSTLKREVKPRGLFLLIVSLGILVGLLGDNTRQLIGAFGGLSTSSLLCQFVYLLDGAHLILVPLLVYPLTLATMDCAESKRPHIRRCVKWASMALTSAIVAVGAYAWQHNIFQAQLVVENVKGVESCGFTPSQGIVGLAGVLYAGWGGTFIGACIWKRSGYKWFFVLQFAGLVGQGAGPGIAPSIFPILSNLFECLFMASIFLLWREVYDSDSVEVRMPSDYSILPNDVEP